MVGVKTALENSEVEIHAHSKSDCDGDVCPVHKRTEHHMRAWPQHWRSDRMLMERTCPHGVGHPDPDHMAGVIARDPENGWVDGVHGCDGCCLTTAVSTEE